MSDYLKSAFANYQSGSMDSAAELCRQAINEDSDNENCHYLYGMILLSLDKQEEALGAFLQAGEIAPLMAISHYNAGAILFDMAEYQQSVSSYQKAYKAAPNDYNICFNLAMSLKKTGQYDEAVRFYKKSLSINPNDAEAFYNLAILYMELGEFEQAVNSFSRAIEINPDFVGAHSNLAYLYHKIGETSKALSGFKQVAALDPTRESAAHMISALSGESTDSAPSSYVKEVFDTFSDYDKNMQEKLEYNTPKLLRKEFDAIFGQEVRFSKALDLGCGTGLSGEQFRDIVDSFVGIDLSSEMLAKAKAKKIYDELIEDELVEFLKKDQQYDFFIAADVLVYLGNLEPLFNGIADKMEPGAIFVFSTEETEKEFCLQPSGRYAHAVEYIKNLAMQTGLEVVRYKEANIRKEKGRWITGNLFFLRLS